jgi:phage-related protein
MTVKQIFKVEKKTLKDGVVEVQGWLNQEGTILMKARFTKEDEADKFIEGLVIEDQIGEE